MKKYCCAVIIHGLGIEHVKWQRDFKSAWIAYIRTRFAALLLDYLGGVSDEFGIKWRITKKNNSILKHSNTPTEFIDALNKYDLCCSNLIKSYSSFKWS